MSAAPFEIERKYLIVKPDSSFLEKMSIRKLKIIQTYLESEHKNASRRIRKIDENGKITFVMTEKRDITPIKRVELEHEFDPAEYEKLMRRKALGTNTIYKTRYVIPFGSFNFEVDIFDGWERYALMEIELENEADEFEFPDFMKFRTLADDSTKIIILAEVTKDRRYRNIQLSKIYPSEPVLN